MAGRVLVLGDSGQLARAFKPLLPDAVYLGRAAADLSAPSLLAATLARYEPAVVINAAAYTQVDKAESEEGLALMVNAESPGVMAAWCAGRNIPFVHFSTDYVFDGGGDAPWKESDPAAPINAYGRTKRAGEEAVMKAGGRCLIFRTSWVYDAEGKNFVNTILRLAAEREELRIVADQRGAPTYAPHLAKGTLAALDAAMNLPEFPAGIYHLCNQGVTSWHGFAEAILAHARKAGLPIVARTVVPIATSDYPLPAQRPHNSRLDCGLARSMFKVALPAWERGLAECMERKL